MRIKNISLLLLILLYTGCWLSDKEKNEEDSALPTPPKPPAPVEAQLVAKSVISREVRSSGVTAGIKETYVISETQGRIEKVNFSLGQSVTRDAILVEVNDVIQKANYEQARKVYEAAKLYLGTVKKLHAEGNASDAELTDAQSKTTGAEAGREAALKAYSDCKIRAPISGYIASRESQIVEGNVLSGGTMITRIVDISSLKATVYIGELEIGYVRKGQKAAIQIPALQNKTVNGTVRAIGAGSDPATGSFPVEIVFPNNAERSIKSGMSIKVTLTTSEPDSALMIPSQVIIEKDRKDAVFIAKDNKAVITFIDIGRVRGNVTEVLSGLSIGDILITTAMTTLSRGDSVQITRKDSNGGR